MSDIAIKVEDLGKLYRLGEVGTGTLGQDLKRWWAVTRGKEDPFALVGETNDRTKKGESEFVWALKDVSFEVKEGEVLGIIGRNGAGKSTLLKLLSKVTQPTTGNIKVKGRIASLLEVGTGFHPDLTGRENVFLNGAILGMTKREIQSKFDEIVDFAGVERYIDTPVKRYSSGMYVRLAFAVAAFLEPEILIVDEVLAVGDIEFQKKCLGRMKDVSKNDGRTVLFVSHQLSSIQSLCRMSILMESGRLKKYEDTGSVIDDYLKAYSTNSSIIFDDDSNPLKSVRIYQDKEVIKIDAEYDCKFGIDIPHLGFIIYNLQGNPVFGSNPSINSVNLDLKRSYKKGQINVIISEPKLLDGTYRVSLWFGDSKENFFEAPDCLTLDVSGMSLIKQYPTTIIGNVEPKIEWFFN